MFGRVLDAKRSCFVFFTTILKRRCSLSWNNSGCAVAVVVIIWETKALKSGYSDRKMKGRHQSEFDCLRSRGHKWLRCRVKGIVQNQEPFVVLVSSTLPSDATRCAFPISDGFFNFVSSLSNLTQILEWPIELPAPLAFFADFAQPLPLLLAVTPLRGLLMSS